jgi:hypothetical protein
MAWGNRRVAMKKSRSEDRVMPLAHSIQEASHLLGSAMNAASET